MVRAHRAQQEHRVHRVQQAQQGHGVQQVHREVLAKPARRGLQEVTVRLAHRVQQEHVARQEVRSPFVMLLSRVKKGLTSGRLNC